jgi:DNA-binding Lrp family transcriptional regulator
MIGEFDLQVVHALQEAPRAPWSVLASILGTDARTVSRRYDDLVGSGSLRIMVTPGPRMLGQIRWALLRAETLPGQAERVARQLATWPMATTIRVLDGAFGIYALLSGEDNRAIWRAAQDQIARIPQIVNTEIHTIIESLDVGRAQRLDSLSRRQVADLRTYATKLAPPDREPTQLTSTDAALFNLLNADGRMEVAAVAAALDRNPSWVSRRISRLQADGLLDVIAVTTDAISSRPVTVLVWCSIDPTEWGKLARAPLAWVGLLAITTGRSNVFLIAHLPALASLGSALTELAEHCPSLQVHETQLSVHAIKLQSRMMDEEERWTSEVSQPYSPESRIMGGPGVS